MDHGNGITVSECPCRLPAGAVKAYCEVHGTVKYRRQIVLCATDPRYRRLYQDGYSVIPSRGLGDTVAKVIKRTLKIRPCGGCRKRQELLNRLVPYKRRVP